VIELILVMTALNLVLQLVAEKKARSKGPELPSGGGWNLPLDVSQRR
jgi:hypothetical protein